MLGVYLCIAHTVSVNKTGMVWPPWSNFKSRKLLNYLYFTGILYTYSQRCRNYFNFGIISFWDANLVASLSSCRYCTYTCISLSCNYSQDSLHIWWRCVHYIFVSYLLCICLAVKFIRLNFARLWHHVISFKFWRRLIGIKSVNFSFTLYASLSHINRILIIIFFWWY